MTEQPKNSIKTLALLHYFLCGSLLLFTAYTYWQHRSFNASYDPTDVFIYLVPSLAFAGYFGSKYSYTKKLRNISREEKIEQRLAEYQAASIISYAFIEAPAFLALFAYLQSGLALYFAVAVCLMLYLCTQRPGQEKLIRELPMSHQEENQFDLP